MEKEMFELAKMHSSFVHFFSWIGTFPILGLHSCARAERTKVEPQSLPKQENNDEWSFKAFLGYQRDDCALCAGAPVPS